jgi:hypothetical protein
MCSLKSVLVAIAVGGLVATAGCGGISSEPGDATYDAYIHANEPVPEDREAIGGDNQTLQEISFIADGLETPPSSGTKKINISKSQYERSQANFSELPPTVVAEEGTELYVRIDGNVYWVVLQKMRPA